MHTLLIAEPVVKRTPCHRSHYSGLTHQQSQQITNTLALIPPIKNQVNGAMAEQKLATLKPLG
jgi:hypothetical protein